MKTFLGVALAMALAVGSAAWAGEKEFSEVEYYNNLAAQKAAESRPVYYEDCPEGPPANAFVVIPQYFHSRNDRAKFKVGGTRLEMAKGHANGAGVTLLYNRRLSDFMSVAFMYQYGFLNVTSGTPVPRNSGAYNREDSRWDSHVFGILPEFNFGKYGKLQLSYIQGFDRASGYEEMDTPGGRHRMDVDDFATDVSSFMAWYEKDFNLGCSNWKITPYAGWRSLYVVVKDQNIFATNSRDDDNLWVHLASGGMKVSYQREKFGFSMRGGINHRTTHDDIPGYGNRAVAPGVVHFSHRANLDKTIGTVGVAASYAISPRAILAVGYDGYFGKDTSAHIGTVSLALPF